MIVIVMIMIIITIVIPIIMIIIKIILSLRAGSKGELSQDVLESYGGSLSLNVFDEVVEPNLSSNLPPICLTVWLKII